MKDEEIIEPSEIIVDQPEVEEADYSHVNPWIRFLARLFDYAFFGLVCFIFAKFLPLFGLAFQKEYLIPLQFVLWIPVEAIFISHFKATPGKLILKTQVKDVSGNKLSYKKALIRSFAVWFRGIGMGIPIINFFAMFFAFYRLKINHITSWDKDENIKITHKSIKPIRLGLAVGFIILCVFLEFL